MRMMLQLQLSIIWLLGRRVQSMCSSCVRVGVCYICDCGEQSFIMYNKKNVVCVYITSFSIQHPPVGIRWFHFPRVYMYFFCIGFILSTQASSESRHHHTI